MNIVVAVGGGFVGQLVQLVLPRVRLLDARSAPTDHLDTRMGPQYLWEPLPGVKNESFEVTTLVDGKPPRPETILEYKRKIGKEKDGGDWGLQFQHKSTGWFAHLPVPRVEYDCRILEVDLLHHRLKVLNQPDVVYDMLVSTIPLPALLTLLTEPIFETNEPFRNDPIYMYSAPAEWHVEGMVLDYQSDPTDPVYRITKMRHTIFFESLSGLPGTRRIWPGKIHPHSKSELIVQMLRQRGCVCFGRFATWRPDELAHESFKQIVAWVEERGWK